MSKSREPPTLANMQVDVCTEIDIARPVEVVASYVANQDNAPEWYDNIKSIVWVTSPPLQVGSEVAFVAHFLGKKLEYTYRVVELDPGRKMVMRTEEGPFPMETTYSWSDRGDGSTQMTLRNRGEPRGFSTLLAPMMKPAMRRANEKDLKKLKAILEAAQNSS